MEPEAARHEPARVSADTDLEAQRREMKKLRAELKAAEVAARVDAKVLSGGSNAVVHQAAVHQKAETQAAGSLAQQQARAVEEDEGSETDCDDDEDEHEHGTQEQQEQQEPGTPLHEPDEASAALLQAEAHAKARDLDAELARCREQLRQEAAAAAAWQEQWRASHREKEQAALAARAAAKAADEETAAARAAAKAADEETAAARAAAAEAARRERAARAEAAVSAHRERAAAHDEEQLFLPRFLALRQHLELLKKGAKPGGATWNLRLPRAALVPTVLDHFGRLSHGAASSVGPVQLWRSTYVTFVDAAGKEAGIDHGGLTAEMHGLFWSEVFRPEHGLFEHAEGGRYLPRPGAPPDQLEAAGRVLLKSVIDDHPTGRLLGRFLFEFLSDAHEWRVLAEGRPGQPADALRALADFDPELAESWRRYTAADAPDDDLAALSLDLFDEELGEGEVTRANVGMAVLAGCRRRLLLARRAELEAFRRGFSFGGQCDLGLQLAPIPCEQLLLMVRGRDALSADDLLGCFDLDAAGGGRREDGRRAVSAAVASQLRAVIALDLDEEQRWLLLRWCTSKSALPARGGLVTKVALLHRETHGPADSWLPEAHTCVPEVELPEYSGRDALRRQLLRALEDMQRGGGFGEA